MEKRIRRKISCLAIVLFFMHLTSVFSQGGVHKLKAIANGTTLCEYELKGDLKYILINDSSRKLCSVNYWPNNNVRRVFVAKSAQWSQILLYSYSGKLICHGDYKIIGDSAKPCGLFYHFSEDDNYLSHIYTYEDGLIIGCKFFHPNGMLETVGSYNKVGDSTGTWLFYSDKGKLTKKMKF